MCCHWHGAPLVFVAQTPLLDLAMMVASVCEMLNRFPRVLDVPAQDPALGPVLATVIESATVNEGANVRATVDVHACCTWS